MNIAIFGGSFDPIHTGHIEIVEATLDQLELDKIIIVPTFLNPFKKSFLATPNVRFHWIKKVFQHTPNVDVSDFEIRQHAPTPTIKTVEYFQHTLNPANLYLIIGADNVPSLHRWQDYNKLKHQVKFIVATRKGFQVSPDYIKLDIDVDISSTDLRKKGDENFLPQNIAQEIIKHYRS